VPYASVSGQPRETAEEERVGWLGWASKTRRSPKDDGKKNGAGDSDVSRPAVILGRSHGFHAGSPAAIQEESLK
jgi:hypothetical protein